MQTYQTVNSKTKSSRFEKSYATKKFETSTNKFDCNKIYRAIDDKNIVINR